MDEGSSDTARHGDDGKADGVRLINGVLFREADLLFGIRLAWLVPNDSPGEIRVVKIRQLDE